MCRPEHIALPLTLFLLTTDVAGGQSPAAPLTLTEAQRAHLRTEQFARVTSVAALSSEVREALRVLFRSPTLELAEPGAEFQVTDVIFKPNLPIRRLILAGCSNDHCLVYYERGGIAHTFSVVLFRIDKGAAQFEWGGIAPRDVQSLDELKALMVDGKIKGGMSYW
jgi:hypothetical protein